ncbi:MAG: DNA-3-methyladenine glycosylase 2 family protein [Bdellovibrionota bacterium]
MEPYKKFLAADKKAQELFKNPIVMPVKTKNVTKSLVFSIMSQQLSVQVANVMQMRFLALYDGKFPSAKTIRETPVEKIRAIGISQSKANYIHNVAEFIDARKITVAKLDKMSDAEIIELLTEIKGVGKWTVEMLLIFGLKREDVFALDDLGMQKAMIHLFKLQDLDKKTLRLKMEKLSQRWSPYRSYICLHMWRYKIN